MLYRKLKIHWTFFRVIALLHWCHGPYARIFTWTISDKRLDAQCLKITQNVSLRFSKTRQNWPFLAFLINFCPLKNVNVARFARNVECDFFCDFQTLCRCDDSSHASSTFLPSRSIRMRKLIDRKFSWERFSTRCIQKTRCFNIKTFLISFQCELLRKCLIWIFILKNV